MTERMIWAADVLVAMLEIKRRADELWGDGYFTIPQIDTNAAWVLYGSLPPSVAATFIVHDETSAINYKRLHDLAITAFNA